MFRWSRVLVLLCTGALAAVACGHNDDAGRKPEPSGGTGGQGGSSGRGGSSGKNGVSGGGGSSPLAGAAGDESSGGAGAGGDTPGAAGRGGDAPGGAGQGGAGDSSGGSGGLSNEEACWNAADELDGEACVANSTFSCGSQCCCGECYPNWECSCDDGKWYCIVIDVFCDDQCAGTAGSGAGGDSSGAGEGGGGAEPI